jgi:hypothetical protein
MDNEEELALAREDIDPEKLEAIDVILDAAPDLRERPG